MNLLYLLYFTILNYIIFALLTKKTEIAFRVKVVLLLFLVTVIVMHFMTTELSNRHFLHLNVFSVGILLFHFGSALAIWVMVKTEPSFKDHIVFSMFNFIRFYFIYILVYLYQLISLLSTEARRYF